MLALQLMETEHIVELAIEQKATVRADLGAVELNPRAAIKREPSVLRLTFTRKVETSPPASDAVNALKYMRFVLPAGGRDHALLGEFGLIYAYRPNTPHHAVSRTWLETTIACLSHFGLSRLALSAVVRILTNRQITRPPERARDAFFYCRSLLSRPNCRLVEPGARHWEIFETLCMEHDIVGPDATDAWFAALAIEHGCEWITCDRRFGRFADLKWRLLA